MQKEICVKEWKINLGNEKKGKTNFFSNSNRWDNKFIFNSKELNIFKLILTGYSLKSLLKNTV